MPESQPIDPVPPHDSPSPAWPRAVRLGPVTLLGIVSQSNDSRRSLWPALILLVAVLAYLQTLGNGFVFDDHMIEGNWMIRSLRHFPQMFTSGYWEGVEPGGRFAGTKLYRPLVIASFAVNYAVGGLEPLGYHAVNILLHAGVSLAIYGSGASVGLSREGAAVAAVLFAVHPLHTEAVAGVVGRAEILMALGVLLALAGYARGGRVARVGSLAAFTLALLAKEQAVVLPGLLVLHELCRRRRAALVPRWGVFARSLLLRLLPFMGILGTYVLLRIWLFGWVAVPIPVFLDNPLAAAPLGPRLLTVLVVAGRYLSLFLWPTPLSPDYSYDQIPLATSPLDGRVLLAILLWGSLFTLALRSFFRERGAVGFAVGFTLFTFLPVSNLLVPIGTIMGERLFYLPSVGLCWLVGLGWEAVWSRFHRTHLRWAVCAAILLAFMAQTLRYTRVWHDDLSLFAHGVTAAPKSAKMHRSVALALLGLYHGEGVSTTVSETVGVDLLAVVRKDEAMTHLLRATEIYPDYASAWNEIGLQQTRDQRWEQALAAFQKVIALDPGSPAPHLSLGAVYEKIGRSDDALAAFRRAAALNPGLAGAHENLSRVYERRGWGDASQAERELALFPADPRVWLRAGSTFHRLGWSEEALAAFRQAAALKPDLAEAHLALARTYDDLGRSREAAEAYEALIQLRPHLPDVHRRLAELYATRLNDPARAEAHLRQVQGN